MSGEKLSILKMIASGRVTAEEGLRLLDALDGPRREAAPQPREARRLRVVATDIATGRRRAQVNVPVGLADLVLRLATRYACGSFRVAGEDIDPKTVLAAIHDGTLGCVLEATSPEEGVKVEVFVE